MGYRLSSKGIRVSELGSRQGSTLVRIHLDPTNFGNVRTFKKGQNPERSGEIQKGMDAEVGYARVKSGTVQYKRGYIYPNPDESRFFFGDPENAGRRQTQKWAISRKIARLWLIAP